MVSIADKNHITRFPQILQYCMYRSCMVCLGGTKVLCGSVSNVRECISWVSLTTVYLLTITCYGSKGILSGIIMFASLPVALTPKDDTSEEQISVAQQGRAGIGSALRVQSFAMKATCRDYKPIRISA